MIYNSGAGFKIWISASNTYPLGFTVDEFADDADPFDVPEHYIGTARMDLNSRLFFQNVPKPIEIWLNVIANTQSDSKLASLFENNFQAVNKLFNSDLITMKVSYPTDEGFFDKIGKIYVNGRLLSGQALPPVIQSGKIKSRRYGFVFEKRLL